MVKPIGNATVGQAYRPDIDGLRAFAILPVLLFHLGVPAISGGFVGVDVFFVISGYLITGILVRELAENRFDLRVFYRRRILRILPPLLVMVLASGLAAWIILLPGEIDEFADTALSAILFYSNVHFWQGIGYFAPDAKKDVLLHTWSLAVEEQFYIIVPLLLMALRRWLWRARTVIMAVLVAGSLTLSIVALEPYAWATFYLLPARFWELGLGALLALSGWSGRLRGLLAHGVSLAGLGMILYAVLSFTPETPFPGANAVLPVAGSAMIILAGTHGLSGQALTWMPLIWIGRISYSLYLWHWPVIVFYKTMTGPDLDGWEMLLLGISSAVLAWLSYLFVERPFRTSRASTIHILWGAGGALGLCALTAAALPVGAANFRSFPSEVQQLMAWRTYEETAAFRSQFRADTCFVRGGHFGGINVFDPAICLAASPGTPKILLAGDSHAAHLWQALADSLPKAAVLQATAVGCRPVLDGPGQPHCTDLMDQVLGEWLATSGLDGVILSGRWFASDIPGLAETVSRIRKAGVGFVIVLGPTVEYHEDLPVLLARSMLTGRALGKAFMDSAPQALEDPMKEAIEEAGGMFVSLYSALCAQNECRHWAGKMPFQFDYGHYTPSGAAEIARTLPLARYR